MPNAHACSWKAMRDSLADDDRQKKKGKNGRGVVHTSWPATRLSHVLHCMPSSGMNPSQIILFTQS